MEILFFYIPVGSTEEGSRIGEAMIHQKLAACANIFPIDSAFMWNDQLSREKEYALILKTMPSLGERLRRSVEATHSYETPCIASWPVTVNKAYGAWVASQVNAEQ